MNRHFLVFGLATVLIAGLGVGVLRTETSEVSYLTAPVEQGDLRTTITATSTLSAVVTVKVGSQLSGQIAELLVDFNDQVIKGQPIAQLDPSTFAAQVRKAEAALEVAHANVASARAALEKAEADLATAHTSRTVAEAQAESARVKAEDAKRSFERKRALVGHATLAQAELDQASAAYASATALLRAAEAAREIRESHVLATEASRKMVQANLEQAEAVVRQQTAMLEQARIDLARTVIQAPIDGVVIGRDIDRGQTVAASLEAPTLFTIAQDLRQMEVHAMIDEADIGKVRLGQRASFTVDAYPSRTFSATVAQIRKAPQVIQNVVTYRVVLTAENADLALLPGMTAVVQIVVEDVSNVLKIPNAALRFRPPDGAVTDSARNAAKAADGPRSDGAAVVWMVSDNGTPVPVEVRLGRSDGRATELADSSLIAGQMVIVGTASSGDETSFLGIRWGL